MYDRFTDRARKVMQLANQEAQRFNHEYIGCEHILIGLLKEGSGVAANVLKNMDMDLRKIRTEIEKVTFTVQRDDVFIGKLPHNPEAKLAIEDAIHAARNLGHNYVGTEHLLLGLLYKTNVACCILNNLGLKIDDVHTETKRLLADDQTEKPIELRPTAVTKISDLYVTGSSGRSGYYCRIETNGDAVEIGFKTHEELLAHLTKHALPSVRPQSDEPIIK